MNGYQWLLFAWYSKQWWLADPTSRRYIPETCDQRMMEDMIEYSILIDHFSHVTTEQKSNPTNTSLVRINISKQIIPLGWGWVGEGVKYTKGYVVIIVEPLYSLGEMIVT